MATQADRTPEAAAEKAYADAAEKVSVKKVAEAVEADAPTPKIDAAVAATQAAPEKAPASKKAAAPKAAAPKKAGAPKAKAKPVRKVAAKAKKPIRKITPAPKPTISELKDKIMATAKNTEAKTADFTKSVAQVATEAQTRAKAAYEKLQTYAGEMTEFSKGNLEALVESGKIFSSGMQDMARGEVEAAKGAFETATADLKAMAAVKSPTELFKLQGEIARRNLDAMAKRVSKNAEISMKLANEAFAPISSRVSVATEKFSKAA